MNNYKKYLPSKKFISIILIIIIMVAVLFVIRGVVYLFEKTKLKSLIPTTVVVGDLIQKDSNNNGIADWEEYLWGLDPTKNGPENKEFILAKKKTLAENNNQLSDSSQTITDNEALSREFFAAIVSLQQTGSLSDESISAISNSIGDNVKAVDLKDVYTANMMTIVNDSLDANNKYQDNLRQLVLKYKDADIGNELTFIIQGLNNKDPQALYATKTVAIAYQNFSKEFIKIPVPKSIADLQLSASNNYEKTGEALNNLTSMLNNPLDGMRAMLNYKKYNDALGTDLEKISATLQQ